MNTIEFINPVSDFQTGRLSLVRRKSEGKEHSSPCISLVKVNQQFILMVLDPDCRYDDEKLSAFFNTDQVKVIPKQEVKKLFPELRCCVELLFRRDLPFPVYCSQRLLNQSTISFTDQNDGLDYELSISDFIRLVSEKRLRTVL